MRHIIIDSAREHLAERRGGGVAHETLGGDAALQVADKGTSEELVRVSEALLELEAVDPELAELVDMRYVGGYSESEIAELQGITDRTGGAAGTRRAPGSTSRSTTIPSRRSHAEPGLDPAVQRRVARPAFSHFQTLVQLPGGAEPARPFRQRAPGTDRGDGLQRAFSGEGEGEGHGNS